MAGKFASVDTTAAVWIAVIRRRKEEMSEAGIQSMEAPDTRQLLQSVLDGRSDPPPVDAAQTRLQRHSGGQGFDLDRIGNEGIR